MAATLVQCAAYGQKWGQSAARLFSIKAEVDGARVSLQLVLDHFVCPLTLEVMTDPTITVDGQVYEKEDIQRWFRLKRREGKPITSPCTGLELPSPMIVSMVALQKAIESFLTNRPEYQEAQAASTTVQRMRRGALDDLEGFSCPRCGGLRAANKRLRAEVNALSEKLARAEEKVSRPRRPTVAEAILGGIVMDLALCHVSSPNTTARPIAMHLLDYGIEVMVWMLANVALKFWLFAALFVTLNVALSRFEVLAGCFEPKSNESHVASPSRHLCWRFVSLRSPMVAVLLGLLGLLSPSVLQYVSDADFSMGAAMSDLHEPSPESLWTEDNDRDTHRTAPIELPILGRHTTAAVQRSPVASPSADKPASQITDSPWLPVSGFGVRHAQLRIDNTPSSSKGKSSKSSEQVDDLREVAYLFLDTGLMAEKITALAARLTPEPHQAGDLVEVYAELLPSKDPLEGLHEFTNKKAEAEAETENKADTHALQQRVGGEASTFRDIVPVKSASARVTATGRGEAPMAPPHPGWASEGLTSGMGIRGRLLAAQSSQSWTSNVAPTKPQRAAAVARTNRIHDVAELFRDAAGTSEELAAVVTGLTVRARLQAAEIQEEAQNNAREQAEAIAQAAAAERDMTPTKLVSWKQPFAASSGTGVRRTHATPFNLQGYLPVKTAHGSSALADLFRDAARASEDVAALLS